MSKSTRMRQTGIWTSVVGGLLTFVGAVTVVVTHDSPATPTSAVERVQPAPAGASANPGAPSVTVTTVRSTPAANRPPGTIAAGAQPGLPSIPSAPPATPEQVAELLAGLPLQLEQAATSGGQPRELTPEEVNRMVDDLLRQLGAKP